jgi:hypothetical protein
VQRLLGRARAQQAAPPAAAAQAEESDQGGEDSEAPREGEPAADTLEERIKRRCALVPRAVLSRMRHNSLYWGEDVSVQSCGSTGVPGSSCRCGLEAGSF